MMKKEYQKENKEEKKISFHNLHSLSHFLLFVPSVLNFLQYSANKNFQDNIKKKYPPFDFH